MVQEKLTMSLRSAKSSAYMGHKIFIDGVSKHWADLRVMQDMGQAEHGTHWDKRYIIKKIEEGEINKTYYLITE